MREIPPFQAPPSAFVPLGSPEEPSEDADKPSEFVLNRLELDTVEDSKTRHIRHGAVRVLEEFQRLRRTWGDEWQKAVERDSNVVSFQSVLGWSCLYFEYPSTWNTHPILIRRLAMRWRNTSLNDDGWNTAERICKSLRFDVEAADHVEDEGETVSLLVLAFTDINEQPLPLETQEAIRSHINRKKSNEDESKKRLQQMRAWKSSSPKRKRKEGRP